MAGNIILDYKTSQIVVVYDTVKKTVTYRALPGYQLNEVIVTWNAGSGKTGNEKFPVTADFKGNGRIHLKEIVETEEDELVVSTETGTAYYNPLYNGWIDLSGEWQKTVRALTLVASAIPKEYQGAIKIIVQEGADYMQWDPGPENSYSYDGYNNYILTLNGTVKVGYAVYKIKYTYTDSYTKKNSLGYNVYEREGLSIREFKNEIFNTADYTNIDIWIGDANGNYVTREALENAIQDAYKAKLGVIKSNDGKNVPVGIFWVPEGVPGTQGGSFSNLEAYLNLAEIINNYEEANQAAINTATEELNAAIVRFNSAKKEGSEQIGDSPLDRSVILGGIKAATDAKKGVVVKPDGTDSTSVNEGVRFVTQSIADALETALAEAIAVSQKPDPATNQSEINNAADSLDQALANYIKDIKSGIKNEFTDMMENIPASTTGTVVFPPSDPDDPVAKATKEIFGQPQRPATSSQMGGIVSAAEIDQSNGVFTWIVKASGYYKVKLWGAQGGNVVTKSCGDNGEKIAYGGGGASTEGVIWLKANDALTFYLGGQGRGSYLSHGTGFVRAGYNGGGKGGIGYEVDHPDGAGGGGKTHLLINGHLIMVAAGGGGAVQAADDPWYPVTGGPGGTWTSYTTDGMASPAKKVKSRQVPGVDPSNDNPANKLRKDGVGQDGSSKDKRSLRVEGNSGGGGGYYGGYANQDEEVGAGSGGTSYISGMVRERTTLPYEYHQYYKDDENYYFKRAVMTEGQKYTTYIENDNGKGQGNGSFCVELLAETPK
ncbi:MAG: hypothetical protein LBD44_06390 [Spirochaetaceae bacterium]|nr:hypothetical protein [Spirochaetaceae bacterium]